MNDTKTIIYKKPLFRAAVILALAAAAVWIFLVAAPAANSMPDSKEELYGNYKFEKQIYMNPLSSFLAFEGFEEYYSLTGDKLTIISATGERHSFDIGYKYSEVSGQDFKSLFMMDLGEPDISQYNHKYQYVLCEPSEHLNGYTLYLMDGDIWLARVNSGKDGVKYIWSIYSIEKYGGELPKA